MSSKHDRIDRVLEELRQGIRTGTLDRVLGALHRLAEFEIHSDRYEAQYDALKELLPRALHAVYASAPLEAFLQLAGNPHVFPSNLYDGLDAHAEELTAEGIIESANALGLPWISVGGARVCPSRAQPVDHRDDGVNEWPPTVRDVTVLPRNPAPCLNTPKHRNLV